MGVCGVVKQVTHAQSTDRLVKSARQSKVPLSRLSLLASGTFVGWNREPLRGRGAADPGWALSLVEFGAAPFWQCTKEDGMTGPSQSASVKVVGANGQISLGKQFAGRQVLVEEQEAGVWLIRTATVIPDNERWIHEPQAAADLQRAMAWSAQQPASDARTDAVLAAAARGKSR
jgi:hypothetical protein